MSGWVKLHRKITENPLYFSEQFNRSMAWIDLILLANHTDNFFFKRGVRVDVKVGQVGYDLDSLAKRWKWSRGKVERFLSMLENDNQIVRQKNNVTTLISIVNYKEYQQDSKPNNKANDKPNDKPNGNKQEGEERKEDKYSFLSALIDYGFDEKLAKEWMQVRKQKQAVNTETAFKKFIAQVELHGGDKNFILRNCVERSWKGFEASWLVSPVITSAYGLTNDWDG